jgi:hypothetical protein
MSSDDRNLPAPSEDLLALAETPPPMLTEPERLVQALRHLQERIPGFIQLSVREKRSYARAANLDPEFLENGLHAAGAWRQTQHMLGRSAEELRQEDEAIRQWDDAIRELRVFTDGMAAANLTRKHRLGTAILLMYWSLGDHFRRHRADDDPQAYMRPYYENMRRAYLRTQKFRNGRSKKEPETRE